MSSIVSTGIFVPPKILSNVDLEKMVETSDEWIRERTGIRERRVADATMTTSDMGMLASKEALRSAGISPEDIDLIIVSTMTPDMLCPSTACLVQAKLGASRAACFDLSAACSGFVYGLDIMDKFLDGGRQKTGLLIGAEKLSSSINWKDRNTCILFGDGAGATVMVKGNDGHRVVASCLGSDGLGADMLKIPAGGCAAPATQETVAMGLHYLTMEGREVFKRAVAVMSASTLEVLDVAGMKPEDITLFIPHQANKRIIDGVAKKLSISDRKIFLNVDKYGNTSAASIIVALHEASLCGRIQKGDYVLMTAFGAGFTWGSSIIQW
ncbi:MAG: beta-ketoacyl-ACP synthase III [Chlamydiota bacterium]|nr:beta-ketoacyl-ACP synthase III [Chlamydiota bacterium]